MTPRFDYLVKGLLLSTLQASALSRDINMTKADDRAASQHGTAALTLLGYARPIQSAN